MCIFLCNFFKRLATFCISFATYCYSSPQLWACPASSEFTLSEFTLSLEFTLNLLKGSAEGDTVLLVCLRRTYFTFPRCGLRQPSAVKKSLFLLEKWAVFWYNTKCAQVAHVRGEPQVLRAISPGQI